jgi:hypothetical protein
MILVLPHWKWTQSKLYDPPSYTVDVTILFDVCPTKYICFWSSPKEMIHLMST